MKKLNKCETCQKLNHLKQRISDLSDQIQILKKNNTELKAEINFYQMNSIPISYDGNFSLWELHNKQQEVQKK
jgi:hypothetical protein